MSSDSYSEGRPMNRAKIMIVDDDPELRQALSLRLRANHYDTLNVCDGYSAIAMAQKEHPHLIILDLGLPAGDGFAVLKNLQQYPALSTIPVIVLTACKQAWLLKNSLFALNRQNWGDRKCLPNPRRSIVGLPDAILFLRISRLGVFQQPQAITLIVDWPRSISVIGIFRQ
jgi:CheY-like chemotaxis protein